MLIRVFGSTTTSNKKAPLIVESVGEGGIAAGHTVIHNEPGPADMNITWTYRKPERVGNDAPTLILESGYTPIGDGIPAHDDDAYFTRRIKNISLSWNNINQLASWKPSGNPSDRWDKLGLKMAPWKHDGEYCLVLGQTPGDMTVCHDYQAFLQIMVEHTKVLQPHPVKLRKHPRITGHRDSLAQDLKHAATVVTFSSNGAVDAVLAGVPTMVLSRNSVAYPVTSHKWKNKPYRPDRQQWANDLAYRQYTLEELGTSTAWEQIEYGYEQVRKVRETIPAVL